MFTDGTVSVITAATRHRNLAKCLRSVQEQTCASVEHFVVIDGPEYETAVRAVLSDTIPSNGKPVHVLSLPYSTGRHNWCGHRIYAASTFLVNTEYVAYLDEDNWYDPDHIQSLLNAMVQVEAHWAFSLRKIVNDEGELVVLDNCESLGDLHHVWTSSAHNLIDTSCYLLPRELAVKFAPVWYGPAREPLQQVQRDGALCQILLKRHPQVACNLKHSLNYTLGTRVNSVKADYFLRGNEVMRTKFPQGLPWEKKPRP